MQKNKKQNLAVRLLDNLSVSKKIWALISLLGTYLVIILVALFCAMSLLAGSRIYIEGVGTLAKHQKDSVINLVRYFESHEEKDYLLFVESMEIPLAAQRALRELEKKDPDTKSIYRELIMGGIHPHDVKILTLIFRSSPYINPDSFQRLHRLWRGSDLILQELKETGDKIHKLLLSEEKPEDQLLSLYNKVFLLNNQELKVVNEYASISSQVARDIQKKLFYFSIIIFLIALVSGTSLVALITQDIKNKTELLIRGAKRIETGDYKEPIEIKTNDEFGVIAAAINKIVDKLQKSSKDLTAETAERNRAEKTLKKTEIFFKDTLDDMLSFIALLDSTGRILFINNTALVTMGLKTADIVGKLFYNVVWPELTALASTIKKNIDLCAKGKMPSGEIHVPTEDGSLIWIEFCLHPVFNNSGRVNYLIAEGRDISIRKNADTDRIRLEAAAEQSSDIIIITDIDKTIQYANHAFERITGYSRGEIIEKGKKIFNPYVENSPDIQGHIEKMLSMGKTWKGKLKNKKKDGTSFYVTASISSIRDNRGKIINYVSIQRDITEELSLKKQLQHAQRMETIGTLAGGIAHDFNNILSPIIGYSELSLMQIDEESTITNNLTAILKSANRAKDLVKQILNFSKKEVKNLKPIKIPILINEALNMLRSLIPATIEIIYEIDDNCDLIMANSTQLHQVIMNLCTNAYQSMEESGGRLTLSLTSHYLAKQDQASLNLDPGKYVCLEVSDTGCGMEDQVMEHIFDPYFTTKEHGKGTGLGLSVVHGIVKSHGGNIKVQSNSKKGTQFRVYLPALIEGEGSPEILAVQSLKTTGRGQILLVDDEKDVVEILQHLLQELGYSVESRISPIDALMLFKTNPEKFDIVITDYTMPNMTGDKLAIEFRKIRHDIAIIMCTGFSEKISSKKAADIGIDALLMKPVAMGDLAEIIKEILDNRES